MRVILPAFFLISTAAAAAARTYTALFVPPFSRETTAVIAGNAHKHCITTMAATAWTGNEGAVDGDCRCGETGDRSVDATRRNQNRVTLLENRHHNSDTVAAATVTTETRVLSPPFSSPFRIVAVAAALSMSMLTLPHSAIANDYNSLTEEQKFVAEAWRLLDGSYLERTFNGQDWFKVRQEAVAKKYKSVDEAKAVVEKIASSLGDRYTKYLPPNKYQSVVNAATGQIAGVGVEISYESEVGGADGTGSGRIIASDVEPTSPAARGGIRKGDAFLEADGERFDTGKSSPDDVAARLRGPEGSKVGVVMERDGKTLDFILTREPIKITAVKSYMSSASVPGPKSGKIGVIKIKNFSGTTSSTVSDALAELKSKGASAIVLDVRNNPGGLLPGGVDTASLFLPKDVPVVFVVNKNGIADAQSTYADGTDLDDPVVVYVNGNTASAAEVMTAALKENGRAVVVGDGDAERTFGKGVVQTIRGLTGGANGGLAITVSRYETPKRNDINKEGIQVDMTTGGDGPCVNEDAAACIPKEAFKKP